MDEQPTGVLIDLADVSAASVPERCHESLVRIKGFIAFTNADDPPAAG